MPHFTRLPRTPHADQLLAAHIATADRDWFVRHPDRLVRERFYFPGEDPDISPDAPITRVVVLRLWGRALLRLYLHERTEEVAA
jgi:hypothetical protein